MGPVVPDDPRLALLKAITGHLIALILICGFFGIAFLAITGSVNLADPTTATFVGTVAGYAVGQLSRPIAYYFYLPERTAEKPAEKIPPAPPAPAMRTDTERNRATDRPTV